jgi:hypothetical protein
MSNYEMRYKEPGEDWQPVTVDEILNKTEGSGYWKPGTVLSMLNKGSLVWTPFAEFRTVQKPAAFRKVDHDPGQE